MIKLVTFDVDGTLIDTDEARYKALLDVLAKNNVNVELDFKDYLEFFYVFQPSEWIKKIERFFGIEKTTAEVVLQEWCDEYEKNYWKYSKLFPNTKQEINNIKSLGIKVGVISLGRTEDTLKRELEQLGLIHLVDSFKTLYFVESNFFEKRKKLLERILELFDVKPEESIHVGDFGTDIEVAKSLGMISVAVKTGHGMFGDLEKLDPDFVIRHVGSGELLKIILSLSE
ncbi:MAG: HAD family hydrolase [Candidatus Aenigmarchaeota archaeon]|nr:HAD family hydrolase [Candidatus Aenigmarchaeota archaeon]